MKAVVVILSIFAFVGCMILGIQAANHPLSPPSASPTQTLTSIQSPARQRTIVFVTADDLQSPTPNLVGVWLVLYRLDLAQISLLPLYPTSQYSGGTDLATAFSLTADHALSPSFVDALKTLNFEWNGYILGDEAALARLIDWINGIDVDGNSVNGSTVLAGLVNPWEDNQGSLDNQKQILQSLCAKTASLPVATDWTALATELTPRHLHTDLNLQLIVADWKDLLSSSSGYTCDFPSP